MDGGLLADRLLPRYGPTMNAVRDIVIVGAGGFGREALDVLRAMDPAEEQWRLVGFVDDGEPNLERLERIGSKWIGTVDQFLAGPTADAYVIAVGNPPARRRIAERMSGGAAEPVSLVHPSATIGADTKVGLGTIICSHVSITTNVRLGNHVHVNLNCTIGHDVRVGDFVTVNPLVAISGEVTVGAGVMLGTTSAILQGLTVGQGAVIGAGAVVVRDVAPNSTVVGIPAKPRLPSAVHGEPPTG